MRCTSYADLDYQLVESSKVLGTVEKLVNATKIVVMRKYVRAFGHGSYSLVEYIDLD